MLLPYSFGILRYLGLWHTETIHRWRLCSQMTYSYFMIIFIYSDALFESIALVRNYNDFQQFVDNSIILVTMLGICGKMFNVIIKSKEIIQLINILNSYPCCSQDSEEKKIQDEFDKMINFRTLAFLVVTESAVILTTSVSIICDTPNRIMFFNTWLPFDTSTIIGYWIAYIHQVLAHFFSALANVAYDTLIPGLMLKICAQLSILEYRLKLLAKNSYYSDSSVDNKQREINAAMECVKHHLKIFQLAERTNEVFSTIMFVQFSISTYVICVTIYRLSQVEISDPEFASMAGYFMCLLSQIFGTCLASTECSIKSCDIATAVYQTDWYNLSTATQKSLLLIMTRSYRPLRFNAGYFIDISLNSFNQLIKLSYSAYNVLQ
ncbi:odorant receptor 46a-like [Microplitis mediator]|uniref:odorant receptor 46a-like n=1 Tax=Microplitis mediator TaxID=375433 RepID=UPI002554F090|nr:odorant receptor 46a-like [Microplitis mediator]